MQICALIHELGVEQEYLCEKYYDIEDTAHQGKVILKSGMESCLFSLTEDFKVIILKSSVLLFSGFVV